MTTTRIVEQFYAAYNAHDVSTAVALYRSDGRHVEVAQGRQAVGRDEIAVGLAGFLAAFPDARWQVERSIVDGDSAAVSYTLSGTLQKQLGPFAPEGQRLALRGLHVLVADAAGELVLSEDYWDSGTFSRQMRTG